MKSTYFLPLVATSLLFATSVFAVDVARYPLPENSHPARQDIPGSHKEIAMPGWTVCEDGVSDCLAINIRHGQSGITNKEEDAAIIYFNHQKPDQSLLQGKARHTLALYEDKSPGSIDDLVAGSRFSLSYITQMGKQVLLSWIWQPGFTKDRAIVTSYLTTLDNGNMTKIPETPVNTTIAEVSFINNQTQYEIQLLSNKLPNNRRAEVADFSETHLKLYLYDPKAGKTSELLFPEEGEESDENEVIAIREPNSHCIFINYGTRSQFSYRNNVYELCPADATAKKIVDSSYRLTCPLSAQRALQLDVKSDGLYVTDNAGSAKKISPHSGFFTPRNMKARPWINGEGCQLANVARFDCLLSLGFDSNNEVSQVGCVINDQIVTYVQEKTGIFLGTAVFLGPGRTIDKKLRIPVLISLNNKTSYELAIISFSDDEMKDVQKLAFQ